MRKQGFHGELCGGEVKFQPPKDAEVTIEDRKIPCRSQQVEIGGSSSHTSVSLCYSDSLAPYILRRESTTTDDEKKVVSESLSEVVALDMPSAC